MTTANQEKVCACDYCGSDYTDAKYCCAARREYLNAHGEFETGRAPAASVGDAPSDAVAAPVLVHVYGKKAWIESDFLGDRHVVVQHDAPGEEPFTYCTFHYDYRHTCNTQTMGEARRMAISLGAQEPVEERHRDIAALSVPATDDKAPAVDAEAVAWRYRVVTNSGARGEWFFSADETKTEGCIEAEPLYAAPTSPHDVDAVRVDEAMVERASEAHAAYLNDETRFDPCNRCKGKGYHHGFGEDGADPDWCEECGGPGQIWNGTDEGAMRAALTAALRKPGGA